MQDSNSDVLMCLSTTMTDIEVNTPQPSQTQNDTTGTLLEILKSSQDSPLPCSNMLSYWPESNFILSLKSSLLTYHPEFSYMDGSLYVFVENTHYSVHKSVLAQQSEFFQSMFRTTQLIPVQDNGVPQGPIPNSHENLMDLTGMATKEEWEHYLNFVYHLKPETEQPLAYFVAMLKLSTLWIHGWGQKHAIKCLDHHPNLTTSLRVHVARKHHVHEWLLPAFCTLCLTPPSNLSKLNIAYMGVDFF
ncbi:hypothetical protein EW145_g1446 [Phellinidium pouzarii]|uniref:BTB domain-containing protein n=1 Tax=Phellinidium pouzarii TaxID=167371 RepID=A0A4S4LEU1_9AGAM|nr:hypothetical protein EW145_g1446 [Phellinidium pouzarii]